MAATLESRAEFEREFRDRVQAVAIHCGAAWSG
jgi:hypothetical protein